MAKWWKTLEEKLGGGPGGANRLNTFRWLLVIAGVGAVLMILNSFLAIEDAQPYNDLPASNEGGAPPGEDVPAFQSGAQKESKFAPYEASYENELKEILGKIVGVGAVDVLVTIDSTEEVITDRSMTETQQETNERDKDGATRHITQTSRDGQIVLYTVSGDQTPLIRKMIKPSIRGVFIVAEGAENITVKKMLIEAVERGLGVPPHKISVAPSKR